VEPGNHRRCVWLVRQLNVERLSINYCPRGRFYQQVLPHPKIPNETLRRERHDGERVVMKLKIMGFVPSITSSCNLFLTACWPQRLLLLRQPYIHGSRHSTTEASRRCSLFAQCSHRGVEPCEGVLQYYAGQARFWLLQRYPHHDQSGSFYVVLLVGYRLIESIQDSMTNEADCIELGRVCADVCIALSRGLNGKLLKDLSDSVSEAVKQLTT
jgi:hypothetical protein